MQQHSPGIPQTFDYGSWWVVGGKGGGVLTSMVGIRVWDFTPYGWVGNLNPVGFPYKKDRGARRTFEGLKKRFWHLLECSSNPLTTICTPKKCRFSWAEEAIFFFTKQIDFPKIRYKNVEWFDLVHAYKTKFPLFFFYCPFPFLFLSPFTLTTFYVSYFFWLP